MIYQISRRLLWLILRLTGRIEAYGRENIPEGGVILAPNHQSHLDPPATGACIARQVHYMAKVELFQPPIFGRWMHLAGCFPVTRGTADRGAIRRALELLAEGRIVCIFPEGTRSDGPLREAELGIGMIALKSGAPVVPVAISGTREMLPKGGKPRFGRVTVTYGKPLTFENLSGRAGMEEVGKRVMAEIADLLVKRD
ncbi:MAG: lysophospholipid acyltransferase family protein [Armatimonadota bacterium]